jgi:hypothetical protein
MTAGFLNVCDEWNEIDAAERKSPPEIFEPNDRPFDFKFKARPVCDLQILEIFIPLFQISLWQRAMAPIALVDSS